MMQWIFVIKKVDSFHFISYRSLPPSLFLLLLSLPLSEFQFLFSIFLFYMVTFPCVVWCDVIVNLDFCRSVAKKTKKNRTAALLSFWFFVSPLRRKTGKNLTNLYTNSFIFFCPLFIPITMPCPVIFFSAKLFFICYFKIQSENTFLQLFFLSPDG